MYACARVCMCSHTSSTNFFFLTMPPPSLDAHLSLPRAPAPLKSTFPDGLCHRVGSFLLLESESVHNVADYLLRHGDVSLPPPPPSLSPPPPPPPPSLPSSPVTLPTTPVEIIFFPLCSFLFPGAGFRGIISLLKTPSHFYHWSPGKKYVPAPFILSFCLLGAGCRLFFRHGNLSHICHWYPQKRRIHRRLVGGESCA